MKINKLKIVSLIVAIFMIFTLFSGCGNKTQKEKNTTKTVSNEKEEPLEIE